MKRLLALPLLALLMAGGTVEAGPVGLSVGVFGGLSIPVLQDVTTSSFSPGDAFGDTGSQFGIRAPVYAIPVITFEPYFSKANYKDHEEVFSGITYTREGFDATSFGLNAILGKPDGGGFHFYPFVGIGKTKLERTGEEINKADYHGGLGFGISPAPKFSIQLRGEFSMVKTGDTSRKFTNANLGVNYRLLP